MRIAYFTDAFYPQVNGVVSSIINTAQELIRLGHEVLIVAPKPSSGVEKVKHHCWDMGIEILFVPGIKALFYPDFKLTMPYTVKIVNRLKDFGAEIIHFHTPFSAGAEAIVAARLLNLPLIGTFHTFFIEPEYLKVIKLDKVRGVRTFGWHYNNWYYNRCDLVLSPSRYTAEELKKHKVQAPVEVFSNGLSFGELASPATGQALAKRLHFSPHSVIYVGRLSEEKCVDVLIRAMRLVHLVNPDVQLLIVGDGPARRSLEKLAHDEELDEAVRFLGMIPHDELLRDGYYQAVQGFVTASTSENQPMTIIEALMAGLPIIGVDERGVPEMITDNGYVARAGDHGELAIYILRLFADPVRYAAMSAAAKQSAQKYNIEKTTPQLLKIYRSFIR